LFWVTFTELGTETSNQQETVSALASVDQLRPPLESVISTRALPSKDAAEFGCAEKRKARTVATLNLVKVVGLIIRQS
jgi:hypothetical protein